MDIFPLIAASLSGIILGNVLGSHLWEKKKLNNIDERVFTCEVQISNLEHKLDN